MFGWQTNENKSRFIGFRNFTSGYRFRGIPARVLLLLCFLVYQ